MAAVNGPCRKNLCGTSQAGGHINRPCYIGCGTVWEITP